MKPLLERHGVDVVALSGDTVEQAAGHRSRDDHSFTILAHPRRSVIKAYGLEMRHMRYVTWFSRVLPIGIPAGFRSMAVPATLLVDEDGIVRWVDAATDHRMRSDDTRILVAVSEAD